MSKQEHDFVVGYDGDHNVIYGARSFDCNGYNKKDQNMDDYCHKMTLNQAKKSLKQLEKGKGRIYQIIDITDAVLNNEI